jgi:hypothetical protein
MAVMCFLSENGKPTRPAVLWVGFPAKKTTHVIFPLKKHTHAVFLFYPTISGGKMHFLNFSQKTSVLN